MAFSPADPFAENCMQIINEIDEKLQQPGNEDALEAWKEGDFDGCFDNLTKLFPHVTEDQWSWIEEFVSEI